MAIGSGYSAEPSVVIPLRVKPRVCEGRVESAEERLDVLVRRIVIEDLVGEPLEGAVVDDREDAEGSVIQLVGSDVAREVRQSPVEIVGRRSVAPPFSPPASTQFWIVA